VKKIFHLATKKGCILYKEFVLENRPFVEGKKRVEFAIFRP